MEKVKLKHLTENSWLVLTEDGLDRVGILAEQREKFLYIANSIKKFFASKAEINDYFNKDMFADVEGAINEIPADYFVNGFPVDVEPIEASVDGFDPAVYKKRATSKVIYVAGHFCLEYPTGWVASHCPKFSTLGKYAYKGPFKTEKEMKFALSRARKE